MTTDDFVTRLREAALASVPPSTLDVDAVLRSSRRKAALWRAGTGAGLCLAVAAGGVGVANALPLVPGLLDGTASVGALAVPDAASSTAATHEYDIPVPGVTAQTHVSTRTTTWDDNTVLLGLGLRPEWLPEDQSLWVEYAIPEEAGQDVTIPEEDGQDVVGGVLQVLVSGPDGEPVSLEERRSGRSTATLLATSSVDGLTVVEGPGGQRLVVGVTAGPTQQRLENDVAHLVLDDAVPDGRGGQVLAVPVPVMDLRERREAFLYAAVLDAQVPGVRAGVAYLVGGLGAGFQACDASGSSCVAYDPASRSVSPGTAPAPPDPAVAELAASLAQRDSLATTDVDLEECLARRGFPGFDANYSDFHSAEREGVPVDVWSACRIDLIDALVLAAALSGG